MTMDAKPTKTKKGERSRAQILEAALALFAERGWDKTTMRAIAERAGVSVGNAYYYFASKEHLIQGFYLQSHHEHLAVCEPALEGLTRFGDRLRTSLVTKIDTTASYHEFAAQLFKTAADPKSPLNPFSPESAPTRNEAIALMGKVVDGSNLKLPADLARELPELLWHYEMAVILFWVHDSSEGQRRTYRLIDRTSDIVARLVTLARNPLLAPLRKGVLRLVAELRADVDSDTTD